MLRVKQCINLNLESDNIVHIQGNAEKGTFVNLKIESANEYELIEAIA